MTEWIPPAAIFILGAFLIPILEGRARQIYMLLVPVLAFINLLQMSEGTYWVYNFLGYDLIFGKVDKLSMVFGYIFVIMAFAGILYALHVRKDGEHIAAFLYVGSALGVVFAGDYFSLFIFWEIMAFASVFLIWYRREKASLNAGFRYILVHVFGGLCLLGGIIMHVVNTGSIEFGLVGYGGLATYLIFIGFILNAAVPPLSAWLSDAYPEATVTGAVFLSAFTTKTAVYVLLRAFPGWEILIYLGTIMTIYGIIFAILENDMRRILAYSIINQVGFMVAGVGIGTMMAINGSAAHAFCHILYKGLLWMAAGSVLYMTGKSKCTELGGLYKTMPLTLIFCMVGANSISAFPLFSGFVSKSMTIEAAAQGNMAIIWLILMVASAGVFLHAGIKFPYFVFFAKDSGIRVKDPPLNMLLAMGFVSFLCIFLGVYPKPLYNILPYPVDFIPYTAAHVVETMQILLFSALAFFLLLKYLERTRTITLDTDWFYRKGARAFLWFVNNPLAGIGKMTERVFFDYIPASLAWFSRNPIAAAQILATEFYLKAMRATNKKREIVLEEKKRIYPGEVERRSPIGTAVLLATIFLLIYFIIFIRR
ncbi:MAG: Na(+)/H(+) antiporter subunit D [Candidatus Hydrothermarchaeota archaeon]|nr:Na(+)/H(+) antiporter subunit D [Candidatus Hydrothermarchaeota archaeon]